MTYIQTRIPAVAWSSSEIKSPQGQIWNLKRKKALNINVILNNMISTNSFLLLLHQHICLIHSLQEFMEPCHLWHFAQALHDSELTMSLTKSLVLVWALCKFLSTLSLCVCDSRKIRKKLKDLFQTSRLQSPLHESRFTPEQMGMRLTKTNRDC